MDVSPPSRTALWAFVAPFALFIVLQAVSGALKSAGAPAPEQWVYPLQTVVCAAVMLWFRRQYPWNATAGGLLFGALAGLAVLAIWIAPQVWFHAALRTGEGFNPEPLRETAWYAPAVGARFMRLAVVAPVLEEIFWRGFVMRYLVREDFTSVPLGTFTPLSFFGVAVLFMLEHSTADYPAAFAAGVIYNLVAVRTRSLPACILAHALTNLLLGFYVMQTRQWGFW